MEFSAHELIKLKQLLNKLVEGGKLSEESAIGILLQAGLAKLPSGEGWIDTTGKIYRFK